MELEDIIEALASCRVDGNKLTVPGLSGEEYNKLAWELRDALISYRIPHWKPVAMYVETGAHKALNDFVVKMKGISKSYAELVPALNSVILKTGGGLPGKFTEEIGALENLGFVVSKERDVKTGNNSLIYDMSAGHMCDALVDGCDIIDFDGAESRIKLLIHRGSGVYDFFKSAECIAQYEDYMEQACHREVRYVPLSQIYDLGRYVTVGIHEEETSYVTLHYKDNVNTAVLQRIFRDWAGIKR